MEIGTEELSHLEVVGALIRMHLNPMKSSREAAEADPLVAIAGGGGVSLFDSMGNAWTANYLKITGDVAVDLRSNIAVEARAKIVYERLISFTQDRGSKQRQHTKRLDEETDRPREHSDQRTQKNDRRYCGEDGCAVNIPGETLYTRRRFLRPEAGHGNDIGRNSRPIGNPDGQGR